MFSWTMDNSILSDSRKHSFDIVNLTLFTALTATTKSIREVEEKNHSTKAELTRFFQKHRSQQETAIGLRC